MRRRRADLLGGMGVGAVLGAFYFFFILKINDMDYLEERKLNLRDMNLEHIDGETYSYKGVHIDMTECGRTHFQMYRHIAEQLAKRQRPPLAVLINEIALWSRVYQINFQFWPDQNNIYISKNGVELADYGGGISMEECLFWGCQYCRKINPGSLKTVPLPFSSVEEIREKEASSV